MRPWIRYCFEIKSRLKGANVPTTFTTTSIGCIDGKDRSRLERFAPLFGINVKRRFGDSYLLRDVDSVPVKDIVVCNEHAHMRLLLEICSKAAPWVYFHFGESCKTAFLGLTDARIRRISQLYQRSRDSLAKTSQAELIDVLQANQ
jgi:hypothetical protein